MAAAAENLTTLAVFKLKLVTNFRDSFSFCFWLVTDLRHHKWSTGIPLTGVHCGAAGADQLQEKAKQKMKGKKTKIKTNLKLKNLHYARRCLTLLLN